MSLDALIKRCQVGIVDQRRVGADIRSEDRTVAADDDAAADRIGVIRGPQSVGRPDIQRRKLRPLAPDAGHIGDARSGGGIRLAFADNDIGNDIAVEDSDGVSRNRLAVRRRGVDIVQQQRTGGTTFGISSQICVRND